MKTLLYLVLLASAFYVPSVWGQCSTGVNTGGQCIPPDELYGQDGARQAQTPQMRTEWADRWGAIVLDDSTGQGGAVDSYANRIEAIDAATHDCQEKGALQCKLELAYFNGCVAVANSKTMHFTVSRPTKQRAMSKALSMCEKTSTDCKVVYTACSLAVRVK